MASAIITSIALKILDKILLSTLTLINKNDTSSSIYFDNENVKSDLMQKTTNYHSLTYKHDTNNPQILFDEIKQRIKRLDIIPNDVGIVIKKTDLIENNDLIVISRISNLFILPFDINTIMYYNITYLSETDDSITLIFNSSTNSYNSEYFVFKLSKDISSVSITLIYHYVPANIYYQIIVNTGLVDYNIHIKTYMIQIITHIFGNVKINCDTKDVKQYSRTVVM
jgi:hypothetical protein